MPTKRINALTATTTPDDADVFPLDRAAGTFKMTWANIKAALVAFFVPSARTLTAGAGLSGGGDLSANRSIAADISGTDPASIGAASAGASGKLSHSDHVHPLKPPTAPIVNTSGTLSITAASGGAAGSMSSADYTKLAGIESAADVTGTVLSTTSAASYGTTQTDLNLSLTSAFTRHAITPTADFTINGIAGGVAGRMLLLTVPSGLAFFCTLGTGGTAANQIVNPLGVAFVMAPGTAALLRYDGTSSRWVVISFMPRIVDGSAPGFMSVAQSSALIAATNGVSAVAFPPPVIQSTSTLTLSDSHNGVTIWVTYAGACTITVPQTLTAGFSCTVINVDAAATTTYVASGTQVLVSAGSYLTSNVRYAFSGVVVRSSTMAGISGTNA